MLLPELLCGFCQRVLLFALHTEAPKLSLQLLGKLDEVMLRIEDSDLNDKQRCAVAVFIKKNGTRKEETR